MVPDVRLAKRMGALLDGGEPFMSTSGQRVAAALLAPGEKLPDDVTPDNITGRLLDMSLSLAGEDIFATMNFPYHPIKYLDKLFPANIFAIEI